MEETEILEKFPLKTRVPIGKDFTPFARKLL
jgi:hypothetical protein